jgi:acetoin utilization deacetylase AcuC-like enzyme
MSDDGPAAVPDIEHPTMLIHFSPDYCAPEVAFDTTRKAAAIAESLTGHPMRGVRLESPTPVTRDELERIHDPAYIDAVFTGNPRELASSNQLPGWDEGLVRAVCASTGGAVAAAMHALEHRTIAGSLSSGLHHARHASGWGYCTFNGLALAATTAIDAGASRVLIIDFDAHCGGGTADLLTGVAAAEQIDVAVDPFDYYGSTEQARLTLTDGQHYLTAVDDALESVRDPGSIDLVLYNAGMDPHERCEGGAAGISALVLDRRERTVFAWLARHRLPTAWVLAGGYTTKMSMAELVHLHRLTIDAASRSLTAYG